MEDFKVGQRVRVKFDISSTRSAEIACGLKKGEHDRLVLEFPNDRNFLKSYIHEGMEVGVLTYTDKGIYCFDSIVIDSPLSGEFIIELPDEKTKIQRREYVRVPIKIDLYLMKDERRLRAETINLGGGGIRFKTSKPLTKDEKWFFNLLLPRTDEFIKGYGEVLYSIEEKGKFVSVIKYTDIDESDRNKVIRACFEEEAHIIKNRWASDKN